MSRLIGAIGAMALFAFPAFGGEAIRFVVPNIDVGVNEAIAHAVGDQVARDLTGADIRYSMTPRNSDPLTNFLVNAAGTGDTMLVLSASDLFRSMRDDSFEMWHRTYPVATVTTDFQAIAVIADEPVHSLSEVIDLVRRHPRRFAISGASPRLGINHVLVAWIIKDAGLDYNALRYLPSPTIAAALDRLRDGQTSLVIGDLTALAQEEKAGRLRILATTAPGRLPTTDAPPLTDLGYDVVFLNWRGFLAPPRTEPERVAKLENLIRNAILSPGWTDTVFDNGWTPFVENGLSFRSLIEQQDNILRRIVRELGAR